jgi:hypothetical protein
MKPEVSFLGSVHKKQSVGYILSQMNPVLILKVGVYTSILLFSDLQIF